MSCFGSLYAWQIMRIAGHSGMCIVSIANKAVRTCFQTSFQERVQYLLLSSMLPCVLNPETCVTELQARASLLSNVRNLNNQICCALSSMIDWVLAPHWRDSRIWRRACSLRFYHMFGFDTILGCFVSRSIIAIAAFSRSVNVYLWLYLYSYNIEDVNHDVVALML